MTSTALEAVDLSFTYGDGTSALESVSLAVAPGEVVAVLGPSGAGKSTLLRCLAGLERPSAGRVVFDGGDLATLGARSRRGALSRIGMVFQEFQLVDSATALSNVLVGRLYAAHPVVSLLHVMSRADRQLAVETLLRLGLEGQLRKRADALSGGQRQRVGLARALVQEPTVLLADEPVANLDPVLAGLVLDHVVALARTRAMAAVLNLHEVALARQVADRVVGLREGSVQFDLPAAQVTDELLAALYAGEVHATGSPHTARRAG